MGPSRLSWLAYGLVAALSSQASAHQLEPIDALGHEGAQVVARHCDHTNMDLLNAETFLWGGLSGKGRYALGNFTAFMPGKNEGIISMEKFYPLLKSTECTKNSLTMNFEDEEAYRYGRKVWNWVNDADDNSFVLVAGRGHCQWNEDRLPFSIKNVEFDDACNTITAIGKATDWVNATHSYELFVGGRRAASKKRDLDDSYTFDISADLPLNSASFGLGDAKLEYTCDGCGTRGEFEFDFHIKTEYLIPTDVELLISPNGVEAVFEPEVKLSANLTGGIEKSIPIGKIPIGGVSIAGGILDLGPEIAFDFVYSLGPLEGSAGLSGGGSASLEDGASLTLDLLDPAVAASGWTPQFSSKPLTLDAALSGSVKIGIDCGIVLSLAALDQGFDVGVKLSPYLGSTISVKASTDSACPDTEGMHYAMSLENSVGIDLLAEASPVLTTTLAGTSWDIGSWCTGVSEGPNVPSSSFASQSLSTPSYSSPTPHYLTSAPPSSFPAPLTSIPAPSSWTPWTPASSAYPPTGSSTVGTVQPSHSPSSPTFRPPPPSSGMPSPIPTSTGGIPLPLPLPTSIPIPPIPLPSPQSSSSSSVLPLVYRRNNARAHA